MQTWRAEQPGEFFRGWRPVVFYWEAARVGHLADTLIEDVRNAFSEAARKLPYETKVWSNFAQFEAATGDRERAVAILNDGHKHLPYSQELNYLLGEHLLEQGNANEAVRCLEAALQCDQLDQFQHHVSQEAVLGRLAQAYEAIGAIDKAGLLYSSIVKDGTRPHIQRYARNRLRAIQLQQGKEPRSQTDEMKELLGLMAAAKRVGIPLKAEPDPGGDD